MNGFINYYALANTRYRLRVGLAEGAWGGQIKMTITPYNASTSYFYSLGEKTIGEPGKEFKQSIKLEKLCSKVLIVRPKYTGSYTFFVESTDGGKYIDSYIYVIKAMSAEQMNTRDYNDDGGGSGQAKLTKQLDGGYAYYVVVAGYNLYNVEGYVALNISKN